MPPPLLGFVAALDAGNSCRIALGDEWHAGFPMEAGIRQGCPLSPLLFAVGLDPFLRGEPWTR